MAENQDGMEKSEDATSKKQEQTRQEGNVAKSQDLTSGVLLLASIIILYFYAGYFMDNFRQLFIEFFQFYRFNIDSETAHHLFIFGIKFVAKVTMPFLAALFLLAVAINVVQVGFHISGKAIEPKFEKLNFFTNFIKTFFNKRKVVDLIKSLFKIFALTYYAWTLVVDELPTIIRMTDADIMDQSVYLSMLVFEVILKISLVVLLLGLADYVYQKWQHNQDIKMTKQEVKEENKQMEGDPMVKNRIRQAQRDMSRQRMMDDVPKADVVITNPTHYAVAIRYDINTDKAPKVVAKGQRLMALKIREVAKQNGIKIHEDPPLARTLYNSVEVDEEIPENLYKALAQILMNVDKFKQRMK